MLFIREGMETPGRKEMNKIFNLLLFGLVLYGCSNNKKIVGEYNIEENKIANIQLTLNLDKSFVEYVQSVGCEPKWFFGFYEQNKKYINLNQISGNLSYLGKKDTIIYHKIPSFFVIESFKKYSIIYLGLLLD